MEIYYWESDFRYGEFKAESDQKAIEKAFKKMYGGDQLLVVYKESETDDGTPFIVVWEK
jgi:hypothetical protein